MKNKQAIFTLFAANTVTGFAQGISMMAIPWYFTNVLHIPNTLGYLFMGILWMSLFWGIYAGSLVDKFNRKHLYLTIQSVGCLVLCIVAGYGFIMGGLPTVLVGLIYASTFLIYNIHYPNLYAFIQEITDPKDYGRVTSYVEIQGQTTTALAGTLGAIFLRGTDHGNLSLAGFKFHVGFDLVPWQLHEIFMMDASTYLLAIALIWSIRFTPVAQRYKENFPIIQRLKTGFNFLRENPMLFLFGVFGSNIFVTILILNFYLKPVYVGNHLHQTADVYASYELYFALGSLLAGLAIRYIFRNTSTVFAVICLVSTAAVIYYLFAFSTALWFFYLGAFLLGLSNAGSRIHRVTYLFRRTPNQIIGRTGSIFISVNVIQRMFFTAIFLMPFFYVGDNIIWAYIILATFMVFTAATLAINYKRILNMPVLHAVSGPKDDTDTSAPLAAK